MTTDKQAAIIGGGVIGGGWAARLVLNGWDVALFDPDPAAKAQITALLKNARRALPGLSNEVMPPEGNLKFCGSIAETVRTATLIIEAVPERLKIKQQVYAEIEAVNQNAVIASSTSGLMPSDLQANMRHPERLIVAHPFNPVYLLPLVELVAGSQTDARHITWAAELFRSLGMQPLHCRVEIEGFISDRLQEALWREALWLLHDKVATAEEIDAAIAYGPGLRWAQMGVMQVFHLAGGEGGMRAMLKMFGPCLKWPWTKLMDVPELSDAFIERIASQCDTQSKGRTPTELQHLRDNNLVAIMRALKGQNWGAGAVLNTYDQSRRLALEKQTPVDFSQLLETAQRVIPLDWLDFNGHMNEARYLQLFSEATDRFMEIIGCDAAYIASGGSYFTAETHIRHLGEVMAGQSVTVKTLCLPSAGKKLHLFNMLYHSDGRLLATAEQMLIHVSLKTRRASPPSAEITANLTKLSKLHQNLPRPAGIGRAINTPL